MTEYEYEPVRGLPIKLPPGEQILWQGSPNWRTLAIHLCHLRFVTGYFAVLCAWSLASALSDGRPLLDAFKASAWLLALLGVATGLLVGFAYLCARTTIYTITNRRVVLRYGIALTKAVNVPLRYIVGAKLRLYANGTGDIPLTLRDDNKLAYLILWPHVRPWRFGHPQPMLRGVNDAVGVSDILRATSAATSEVDHAKLSSPVDN